MSLGGRNQSNSHQLARVGEKIVFHEARRTSCLENSNQMFLASGGRNESNSHQLARTRRRKFFMNSRRRKFFMNSANIMSTK